MSRQSRSTRDPSNADVAPLTPGLTTNEAVGHYIALWKTSIEVQKHFNDIEWRIRGLALTVATFALGAAGVAARDGSRVGPISLGSAVLALGLILWYAFYFVDRYWYHPLLKAAVAEGTRFENVIQKHLPEAHLTGGITEGSPQPVNWVVSVLAGKNGWQKQGERGRVMHSDHKLRWFYRVGACTFVIGAIALQAAVWWTGPSMDSPMEPPAVTSVPSSTP